MSHTRTHSVDSEMHELNQEADYLEEKTLIVPGVSSSDAKLQRHNSDPDAQAMVIESLRAQIQDLFSQVSQLNNKLVSSYDRMSDLEDELHVTTANLRTSTLKISELELERSQHLSALSTGLLVEKDHVTAELNRLMEKATEEAAQRGQAETARAEIEKDLDDLSATLFNQANSMVAEARIARARSERKAEETERSLKEAEEVVQMLQEQMQALQAEKEHANRTVEDMRITIGKGKWVDRVHEPSHTARPRLLCSHAPYQEYIAFISHLRSIRPASQHPPAMSTLLPLPFLARLVAEDSDPTVRLDLAPSLNWLSRRSVISAIHSGQLTVEPMSTVTLLEELSPSTVPGHTHHTHVSCALCGSSIIGPPSTDSPTAATFASPGTPRPNINNSWSSSLFKTSLVQTISAANPGVLTHTRSQSPLPPALMEPPAQVYIFRVAATSSGLPVSIPLSSQQNNTQNRPTIYPLCTTKWCLARLRTTCSMWAFVRTGIVEKVWEESAYVPPAPVGSINGVNGVEKHGSFSTATNSEKKPPVPPRRSRMGIGALWGSVQRSLSSSGKEIEADLPKLEQDKPLPKSPNGKFVVPPPQHPSLAAPPITRTSTVPPPLPKRNRGRDVKAKTLSSPGHVEGDDTAMPPMARVTSSDVFATPSEEPTSFMTSQPLSPSVVPLPPSSPPSPEPRLPSGSENQPSQSSAEASHVDGSDVTPASAVPHSHAQEEQSSRGASPAPPPLPRRAAARPRPVSIVAPPLPEPATAENADSAPGESKNDQAPAPESQDDTVAASEEQSTAEAPLAEPEESAEVPDADVVDSVDRQPPTSEDIEEDAPMLTQPSEEHTGHPQAEGFAEASQRISDDISQTAAAASADAEPHDEVTHEHYEERTPSPIAPSTNGVVEGVEGQSIKEHRESVSSAGSHERDACISQDGDTEEHAGLYVGDATWEERTWKELVRLREEMFWARIGGVR